MFVSACVTFLTSPPSRVASNSWIPVGTIAVDDSITACTEAEQDVAGAARFSATKNGPPLGAHDVVTHTRGVGAVGVPGAPTPRIEASPMPELS